MVSGTMALTKATLISGSGAITAQRGTQTWGANYTFNPSGLQNDILQIGEAFRTVNTNVTLTGDLTFTASGSTKVGSAAAPIAVSGIYMNNVSGVPMRLVIYANGLVSGVAA